MKVEQLEFKRAELNILLENFSLSSESVVEKAREFEELANKTYGIKDGVYWMQRAMELERLLREVQVFCPIIQKNEIEEMLKVEEFHV
jgi:hypothetical protein